MKAECESKCRLLRVAMQLISENSYGSVSVDDICKKAGVNKGSFYHFFPSKADLTVAAMEADWQAKQGGLDCIFSPQLPGLARLDRYAEAVYTLQQEKQTGCGKVCGCPMITLGSELSTQEEKIRLKTVEIMGRYVRYFESAIRDAIAEGTVQAEDPRFLAEELFAYSQGMLLQARVSNDTAPLQRLGRGLRRMLPLAKGMGTAAVA